MSQARRRGALLTSREPSTPGRRVSRSQSFTKILFLTISRMVGCRTTSFFTSHRGNRCCSSARRGAIHVAGSKHRRAGRRLTTCVASASPNISAKALNRPVRVPLTSYASTFGNLLTTLPTSVFAGRNALIAWIFSGRVVSTSRQSRKGASMTSFCVSIVGSIDLRYLSFIGIEDSKSWVSREGHCENTCVALAPGSSSRRRRILGCRLASGWSCRMAGHCSRILRRPAISRCSKLLMAVTRCSRVVSFMDRTVGHHSTSRSTTRLDSSSRITATFRASTLPS
mmetsp:Transcript_34217/g.98514  ORF Transcript_34217/g.98514 Transcript_34217/m.98514 type:complete len:283 (-) Transcript_34217:272-1120(-)